MLKREQAAILAAQGMTVRGIAEALNVSNRTVHAHLHEHRKYAEDVHLTIRLPIDTYTALKDKGGSPAGFAARLLNNIVEDDLFDAIMEE